MKLQLAAAAVALAAASAVAAQETYVIDPVHSMPMFEVSHMGGMATIRGMFTKATGKVVLDRAAKKGAIDVTIDVGSIDTNEARRDNALKGGDFFNVAAYPTMTFKAADLQFDGDTLVGAKGELTILGIAKPVALKVVHLKCGPNPFNKREMCGAEVTATILRSEWGMKTGIPLVASDEVRIVFPVEAYRE